MTVCFVLTQTCLLLQLALTEHLLSQGSVLGPLDTVLSQEGQDSGSWSSHCRVGDPAWEASDLREWEGLPEAAKGGRGETQLWRRSVWLPLSGKVGEERHGRV